MRAFLLTLTLLALSAGCGKKAMTPAAIAPLPPNSAEYVDLQPGWRLRIVAAVTQSGKYEVETKPVKQEGNAITLKLSPDLIGYETAFWSIQARSGGGIQLALASAQLTVDGNPSPIIKPTRALLHAPRAARYIRIFYYTRKSDADHNMLIAGAPRLAELDVFTRAFHETPITVCDQFPKQYCEWIPAGLAVRPEVPKLINGALEWPPQ